VAANCAVPLIWPVVTIANRRYVDGGMRSAESADRVENAATVVILSPLGRDAPSLGGNGLRAEIGALEERGVRVVVVEPDAAAKGAMGINALDPAARTPTAEAGRAQGKREAVRIADYAPGLRGAATLA
jgi:NTE family protein